MNHTDPILQKIARFSPQDILLADVAIRIQLSPTEYLAAIKHFETMAEWIDRRGSPLEGRVSGFYAQGGFSTGSVISSHNDGTEFDLDAMAQIDWTYNVDPEYALATTHDAIAAEEGSRYHDKAERKTRCTQIQYDGMHLDVTPAVLVASRDPKTSLIFHSKPSDPTVRKQALYANPFGLAEWFNGRTKADVAFGTYFEQASLDFSRSRIVAKADATPVPAQLPAYRKSRQVISLQLIKRWRNVAYDRRHRSLRLPPSVLLTYYVGEHAGPERSLLDELIHHVNSVILVVETAAAFGQLIHEANPTCDEDILTDRWPGNLADQSIFLDELRVFVDKLDRLKKGTSLDDMRTILEDLFGGTPAREAMAAFRQRHVDDNAAGKGLYMPGIGAVPALGSTAVPLTAKAVPYSTPFGD